MQGASSRNLYRPSPRQGNDAFEARIIVCESQFAAMEPGHRGCQAQAKARSRFRAALFQPHKTLDHTRAVRFRNTWSAIGYRQQNPITLVEGAHDNLGRHAVGRQCVDITVISGPVETPLRRLSLRSVPAARNSPVCVAVMADGVMRRPSL